MVIGKLKVSDMMTSYMSEIYIEAGGVLPETLRRGPYAVVERAERAKPLSFLGLKYLSKKTLKWYHE